VESPLREASDFFGLVCPSLFFFSMTDWEHGLHLFPHEDIAERSECV
jgi:hypothetical protein